jgi:rare lipoprotein A
MRAVTPAAEENLPALGADAYPERMDGSRVALATLATYTVLALGCAGARPHSRSAKVGETETGLAAYYADSLEGRPTASGEPYDKNALTAAHRELPFGTIVLVTNVENRKSVRVRIDDRGPHGDRSRIIDLSRAAAERIDMLRKGVAKVRIEVVEAPD